MKRWDLYTQQAGQKKLPITAKWNSGNEEIDKTKTKEFLQ